MPVFRLTIAQLYYAIIAVIILLVPTARTIERLVVPLAAEHPSLFIGTGLFVGLLVIVSYARAFVLPRPLKEGFILQLGSAIALLVVAILLVRLPVEYGHIILYGALGFVGRLRAPSSGFRAILIRAALVGLADELLQAVWPNRFFDLHDLFLNLLAAAAGICAAPGKSR